MDGAVWFIEAGRAPTDRLGGAGPLLGVAGLVGVIPLAIEGSTRALIVDGFGWAPRLAQIATAIAAIALVVMSVVVASRSRERQRRDLARLGETEEAVDPTVVEKMHDAIAGSFRLPLGDIELLELVADEEVRIRTRLDDVYVIRVVPERRRFLELLEAAGVRPA